VDASKSGSSSVTYSTYLGGTGGDTGGGVHFYHAKYSWARNIEVDHTSGTGVNLDECFRCELRDSYVHHAGPWTGPNPGGAAYLTGLNAGTSDSLLENNIVWNGNKLIVARASGVSKGLVFHYFPATRAVPETPYFLGIGPPAIGPIPYPGAPPYGAPLYGPDGTPLYPPPLGAPPAPAPDQAAPAPDSPPN